MKIDVHFEPAAPLPDLTGSTVVVIDVLRATSSVVEALVNGARGVYPAPSTEEAIKLASSLGREDTILCGEARGLKVEGFDLGNSPQEFSAETVAGKRLVMSTTNGTRALFLVEDAVRVLICSFTNLSAVAAVAMEVIRSSSSAPARRGYSLSMTPCVRGPWCSASGRRPMSRSNSTTPPWELWRWRLPSASTPISLRRPRRASA